jgi:hypothetical protein
VQPPDRRDPVDETRERRAKPGNRFTPQNIAAGPASSAVAQEFY